MTIKVSGPGHVHANGDVHGLDEYIGYGEDHVKTFDIAEVVELNAPDVATDRISAKLSNGKPLFTSPRA